MRFNFAILLFAVICYQVSSAAHSIHSADETNECEAGINKQINLNLHATYTYLAISHHFDQDDVALHGFAKYFHKLSVDKRAQAEELLHYQDVHGGHAVFEDVHKPTEAIHFADGTSALNFAIEEEKKAKEGFLALLKIAEPDNELQTCHYVANKYLIHQVELIHEIQGYVTGLKRAGPGLGEFLIDKKVKKALSDD